MSTQKSARVFSLDKYREYKNRARIYWNMTRCGYKELHERFHVDLRRAKKWELDFVKERGNK